MTKHTPGPWKTTLPHGADNDIFSAEIAGMGSVWAVARVCRGAGTKTEAEAAANARLITAAPDMLTALVSVIEWTTNEEGIPTDRLLMLIRNAARAAIQKATA